MKHAVVTTFHNKGYQEYGRKCIESFLQFWPKEVTLCVVTEDVAVDYKADNLYVTDQKEFCPALTEFKNKYRNHPNATGLSPHKDERSYLWDAVRFSNKVFAVTEAARKLQDVVDQLIWLDADVMTKQTVTKQYKQKDQIGQKANTYKVIGDRRPHHWCERTTGIGHLAKHCK